MSETLALQPYRRIVFEQTIGELGTFSYLIGNTKPISIDTSGFTALPVRCLFLGSGDLRHALHSVHTSLNILQWEMYAVDINPAIVARNLLFLQALKDGSISSSIIWSIWYEFLLDSDTNKCLQKLICTTLTNGLESVRESDRAIIIDTLLNWLHFTITATLHTSLNQRKEHLKRFLTRNTYLTFDTFIDNLCEKFMKILFDKSESKLRRLKDEIKLFSLLGVTGTYARKDFINVTMLQPTTGLYTGHYAMNPFDSYFPFENESEVKFFRDIDEDETYPLLKYCLAKFDEWIYSNRARSTDIVWHLWCGDALNLTLFHMSLLEFDLIHTSNLVDNLGLLDILVTCMPLLRHRASSCILTQSLRWWSTHGHCINYLQEAFNDIDVTWFPSLLGLKVHHARDSQRHYILPNPTTEKTVYSLPFEYHDYQTWHLAIGMHIRSNTIHQDTLNALDQLAQRCFYPPNTVISPQNGRAISTTLTYYLLLRQYAKRCYIRSDEIFDYLLNRTYLRYRAYATGLQALHHCFTGVKMVNSYKEILTRYSGVYFRVQSHLPMLQLLIIDDIDDASINKLLQTKSIDLTSGKLISFATHQTVTFHLIDNITFKMDYHSCEISTNDPLQAYTSLAENATLEFILPSSVNNWKSSHAFLIDAHSWYPFAKVNLSSPMSLTYPDASFAMSVRDAVCSCFANPMDRIPIMIDNKKPTNIQLMNAYETVSDYHLLFRKGLTDNPFLLPLIDISIDEHLRALVLKFMNGKKGYYAIDFPCPLQWYIRPVEYEDTSFHIILPKDTAELLSSILFNRNKPIFDRQQMTLWPCARFSCGKVICPVKRGEQILLSNGDVDTLLMHRALTRMFSSMDGVQNKLLNSKQNIDYELRQLIFTMYYYVYLSHTRVFHILKPHEQQQAHLITELIIIIDGVYRRNPNGEEPYLPLIYLDTRHYPEPNNNDFINFFNREINIQANNIAKIRGSSDPADNQPGQFLQTWNEVSLLRKLLQYNSKRMTIASKKHEFPKPWKSSFIEPLCVDSRCLFGSIVNPFS